MYLSHQPLLVSKQPLLKRVWWHAGKNHICMVSYCGFFLNNVSLKIPQSEAFFYPTYLPEVAKNFSYYKLVFMNSQAGDLLTVSWGFHFEHCYWKGDCDQFSFSWMGDCRRPLIPQWRDRHFASASHQRHNWGLLSLGRCCIYINLALPPRNSNDCRLGSLQDRKSVV